MPARSAFYDRLETNAQLSDAIEIRFQLSNNGTQDTTQTTTPHAPTANNTTLDFLAGTVASINNPTLNSGNFNQLDVYTRTATANPFLHFWQFTFASTAFQGGDIQITQAQVQFVNEKGGLKMADSTNFGAGDGRITPINDFNGTPTRTQTEAGLGVGNPVASSYFAPTPTITNTAAQTFTTLNGIGFSVQVGTNTTIVSEGQLPNPTTYVWGQNVQLQMTQYDISW